MKRCSKQLFPTAVSPITMNLNKKSYLSIGPYKGLSAQSPKRTKITIPVYFYVVNVNISLPTQIAESNKLKYTTGCSNWFGQKKNVPLLVCRGRLGEPPSSGRRGAEAEVWVAE